MNFLYPGFLFAFLSLSIPLFIHLFNFRRYKKVYFTNVSMLRDIEIASKSTRRLKNWLVLLARALAFSFLILAFAQPYIEKNANAFDSESELSIVYLDNSFSMKRNADGRSLLEWGKEMATGLVSKRGKKSGFHLITNDFRQSEFNRLTKDEMISEINSVGHSVRSRSAQELINRFNAALEAREYNKALVFLFSDFQKNQFRFGRDAIDTNFTVSLIKLKSDFDGNLSLDSCWLNNPGPTVHGTDSLTTRLSNFSDEAVNDVPVKLFIDEKQVWLSTVDVGKRSSVNFTIPLSQNHFGHFMGKIEVLDESVDFDNNLYFSYKLDSAPRVYAIGRELYKPYFTAVYNKPFDFRMDNEKNTDVSFLNSSSAIILVSEFNLSSGLITEISNRVRDGSSLLIIPHDSASLRSANELLLEFRCETFSGFDTSRSEINKLNVLSDILKSTIKQIPDNPNLPFVKGHFIFTNRPNKAGEDLMAFDNGDAAMRRYGYGEGNILVSSFSFQPSAGNILRHSLVVPLLLNIAFKGNDKQELYYSLSEETGIRVNALKENESIYHIRSMDEEFIPEIRRRRGRTYIAIGDQISHAGNYDLVTDQDGLSDIISLNYLRRESDMTSYTEDELREITENSFRSSRLFSGEMGTLTAEISQSGGSASLWKYCIILVLLFMLAEILLLNNTRL